MRVALVARSAHPLHEPGGMERAVYHLARGLRARGAETVLVTRPPTRRGDFPGDVLFVPYGSLPFLSHGRVLDRTLHYPGFARRAGHAVARLVCAAEVDVVDAQGVAALGYGRLRRDDPTLGAPLVMNPQGMEEHRTTGAKRLALARLRALSREAAALSDRVVATDEATRHEVPRLLHVPEEKVVVVPNGVDLAGIASAAAPGTAVRDAFPFLAGADPLLVSVGRLEPYKGFADVLSALERVHRAGALGPSWAWALVGEGPDRTGLERQAAALRGHVHLLGRVDESLLHGLYARADAFVHATRFEGSSLVTLEAMAHGLPVVATRAGGIPDKVMPGQTGWLVEPGDTDALAVALGELAADPERRRAYGAAGRARVQARFSVEAMVDRALAVYEELLRGRR